MPMARRGRAGRCGSPSKRWARPQARSGCGRGPPREGWALRHHLADVCSVGIETGELLPAVTIVTDNGGPFRFEASIAAQPELTPRPNPGPQPWAERVTRARTRTP